MAYALYKAALYVSYADLRGDEEAMRIEIAAFAFIMQIMEKQNSPEDFMAEIARHATDNVMANDHYNMPDDEELKALLKDLEDTPQLVERAVNLCISNFSKSDSRLYTEVIIAACASVAQAHDEKDDFVDTGDFMIDFLANIPARFERILMLLNSARQNLSSKYLYEENDIFDELKISAEENKAIFSITNAIHESWHRNFPKDKDQTVLEYIEEISNKT